jgi:AAA+ superfamily predicted ATPase
MRFTDIIFGNSISVITNDLYSQVKQLALNKFVYSRDITDFCRYCDGRIMKRIFKNIPTLALFDDVPRSYMQMMPRNKVYYDFIKYKGTIICLFIAYNVLEESDVVRLSVANTNRDKKILDIFVKNLYNYCKRPKNLDNRDYYAILDYREPIYYPNRSKRTFDDVFIKQETQKQLESGIHDFLNNRKWYEKHNIPYHYGIMLYGPPGTGKSSLISAIANKFNLVPYIIKTRSINDVISNNQDIRKMLMQDDNIKMFVIEDIDSNILLNYKKKKEESKRYGNDDTDIGKYNVEMSEFLNIIDGVNSFENVIWLFTTNHIEELDEALLRKGRVDNKILIDYVCDETFKKFMKRHYDIVVPNNYVINDKLSFAEIQLDVMSGKTADEIIKKYCKDRVNK